MSTLAEFRFPAPLARLVERLPQLPPALALVAGLNLSLGRLLPRESLAPLEGKRFLLRVTDVGLALRFGYGARGFAPLLGDAPVDLSIAASARDFLALALREEDPDTLFFSRRLLMQGDTELGLIVKNTLDTVELPPALLRLLATLTRTGRA